MANYSDWASEKSTAEIVRHKMTGDDRRAVLFFVGVTAGAVVSLIVLGSSFQLFY
jgi:hypothetical protein